MTPRSDSDQSERAARARLRSPAERLGFRRIELVEVVVDDHGRRAFVTGTTHRLPRTVSVPWSLAAEVVAMGVPLRTVRR